MSGPRTRPSWKNWTPGRTSSSANYLNMIGIIDYNAGNITSVGRALDKLGIEHILSSPI